MNNFGVELFLKRFLEISGPPTPRATSIGVVGPQHPEFSAFVFKLQVRPRHQVFSHVPPQTNQMTMSIRKDRTPPDGPRCPCVLPHPRVSMMLGRRT
jgi:hypothetical protein